MALASDAIANAYREACLAELQALKVGNVHVHADGHRMTVADFAASADASAGPIARAGARVGERVRAAIEATVARVGCNTNLGIVLLCAPLAAAAERPGPLEANLARILADLDRRDAVDVFAAIRIAAPAGLGRVPRHDVAEPPAGTLLEAMAEAAERDRIARAYVTGFEDLFAVGLPALAAARAAGDDEPWCTSAVHLAFLARFPDTHIVRKHGPDRAEEIRHRAEELVQAVAGCREPVQALIAFDAALKAEGLNPGTSADLTVATLFIDRLRRLQRASERLVATESRE